MLINIFNNFVLYARIFISMIQVHPLQKNWLLVDNFLSEKVNSFDLMKVN